MEIISLVLLPLAVLMVACEWLGCIHRATCCASASKGLACWCDGKSGMQPCPSGAPLLPTCCPPADSTVVFIWRNSQIAMKQASYIDDRRWVAFVCAAVANANSDLCVRPPSCTCRRPASQDTNCRCPTPALPARSRNAQLCRGPLLLAGMVVSALTSIFLVSCVDLVSYVPCK